MRKYDWSRDVKWAGDKASCLPHDVMSPRHISKHNSLCRLAL